MQTLFGDEMKFRCVFSGIDTASGYAIYRYRLSRIWDDSLPKILFAMLNPSTADEQKNDPTVSRCIAFAKLWGFGTLEVVNIFALRSTDPAALYDAADPVGPENHSYIRKARSECSKVIAAWGEHGVYRDRGAEVLYTLRQLGPVHALKLNKSGMPVHPLYQPSNIIPIEI